MKNKSLSVGIIVIVAILGTSFVFAEHLTTKAEKFYEKTCVKKKPKKLNKLQSFVCDLRERIDAIDGVTKLNQSDFYFVETPLMTVNRGNSVTTAVGCTDINDIAISGGFEFITGGDNFWNTHFSRPDVSIYTWVGKASYSIDSNSSSGTMVLRAMCLKAGI